MNLKDLFIKRIQQPEQQLQRSSTNNFDSQNATLGRLAIEQFKKLNDALGGGNGDLPLREATEKLSIVNSSIRLIVDNISKCELQIVKYDGKKTTVLTDHYLYNQLRFQPSTIWSYKNWMSNLLAVEAIHGNTYFAINDGSFDFIDPSVIDKASIQNGKIFYQSSKDKKINYRQDEILHFKSFSEGIFGLSRLKSVALQIQNFYKTEKTTDSIYSQGLNSRIFLDPIGERMTTTEKQDELIAKIQAQNMGYANAGVLVTPFGFNLKSLTIPREDEKIIMSTKMSEETIASAFGVPLLLIKPSSTVAVKMEELKQYLNQNLINMMENIESELNNKLIDIDSRKAGVSIRFNKSKLYVNDLSLLTAPLNTLVTSGIITRNEARTMLGYDNSDESVMDKFTAQIQNATVDSLDGKNHPLLNQNNVDNKLKQTSTDEAGK